METTDCNTTTCSFCSHLRKVDYLESKQSAEKRLIDIVAKRMSEIEYTIPLCDKGNDWDYDEYRDNELSLKGEPA